MDLSFLQRFMCELGVDRNPSNLSAVIRFVQRIEGNQECFACNGGPCSHSDCTWSPACPTARREAAPTQMVAAQSWPKRAWSTPTLPKRERVLS